MRSKRRNRGSTFILVLAMLSILVLIAAAFSYTSRLEAIASANYSQSVQAQSAAQSGLVQALPLVREATSITSTLQPWSQTSQRSATASSSSQTPSLRRTKSTSARTASLQTGPQASLTISDLCGRVNVNAISSDKAFERFLSAVSTSAQGRANVASNPHLQARALFSLRKTDPGTTSGLQPDLRKPAKEGTRRVESLQDLRRKHPRSEELFSDEQLRLLSSYLTVFSESPEIFNRPDGESLPKASLHNLSAPALVQLLGQAFSDKDPRLLMQFAANVVDFVDEDDLPTQLKDPSHPEAWNTILGFEQTPLITEVFPNSSGPEKSESGCFVEIYNPWERPMRLNNWHLVVGGGIQGYQGGGGVALNLVLPPGGYVIVTDNYDKPANDSSPGKGAFLAVFGTRRDQNLRQVVEDSTFALPPQNSFVTLVDGSGQLIDIFSYTASVTPNSRMSYQRNDPRVRGFALAQATPFEKPAQGIYTGSEQTEKQMREAWRSGNTGSLSSPIDLLRVSTAYAGLRATDKKSLFELHSWQMPDLGHFPNDTPSNLDAYVSDLFTTLSPEGETTNSLQAASPDAVVQAPSARAMATSVQSGRQASTPATARASMPAPGASGRRPAFAPLGKNQQSPSALPGMRQNLQADSAAQPAQSSQQTPTGAQSMAAGNLQSGDLAAGQATTCSQQLLYAFGRLNLNTCSKAALYSLDDSELITPELVERFDQYRSKRLAQKKVPFLNVSDFLVEFFPRPSEKQLQAFAKLAEQITVSSSSFEVVAENRLPIEEKSDSKRQPTLARVRWAITLDREPYSLINFSIQP